MSDELTALIRFRAEPELKAAINRVAKADHKKPSEFMRETFWKIVELRGIKREAALGELVTHTAKPSRKARSA